MTRRRTAPVLMAVLLCCVMAACGPADEPSAGSPERGNPPQETVEPVKPTEPDAAEPPPVETAGPEPGTDAWIVWEDLFLEGYDLMESESLGELRLGMTSSEVEAVLGEPLERSEPEYWEADGLTHTRWIYDGAELSFAVDQLETVAVTAPFNGATAAGIRIGSSETEVREAYEGLVDEEMSTSETVVAGSVYAGLRFTLSEGSVQGIVLGSSAE